MEWEAGRFLGVISRGQTVLHRFRGFRGFRRFKGFKGLWYRLTAISMKTALRDLRLCHYCCIAKSQSPLPQKGGGAAGDGG